MSWKGRAAQLQWEREHGVDPLAFDGCRSSDGALMFQHAPMLEIDGMKLVQIKAISPRSTTCTERTSKIESYPKPKLDNIQSRAKERYLPVYEKALTGPFTWLEVN
ncbi:glutathione S-transferase A2 isoform X1 [Oreochromis niloticus]|uniref:glutathione S-transferase A2 isoform X1 n=1 Tax=Oreochromis niloticus TaxID=8128 RepID=UPI000905BBE5|nr:glutathione S-transferase A2 isoform X1 [Oreochromis niloticus]